MKKNDCILYFIVFFAILVLAAIYFLQPHKGDTVIIRHNGNIVQKADLNTNAIIDIGGKNTVVIEDGQVYMQYADCPDKLCMRQGSISDNRKEIICLPNRVTISVIKKSEYDAISR